MEATALAVDPKTRTIRCHGETCDEECRVEEFDVPYDRLVVTVGAKTNTFGIPGVEEHCSYLKQVSNSFMMHSWAPFTWYAVSSSH